MDSSGHTKQGRPLCAPAMWAVARGLLIVALCAGAGGWALGHERPSYPVDGVDENMTVRVPRADKPPVLDGKLSPGEWEGAARLSKFRCVEPQHGALSSLNTTVYLMSRPGHLYVAFECEIAGPGSLIITETREDAELRGQDRVCVILDTLHDHRRSIELAVTPRGTKYDARWGNFEWDAVWDVATAIYDDRYIVEMDIDLGSLTYEKAGEQTIGANFARFSQSPNEDTVWALDERTTVWRWDERKFPHLAGLIFPEKPAEQNVRVDAFVVAINEWEPGGGFRTNQGLDIEYPLTTSITSRYVLFPDFSDVEAVYESIDVSYREQFLPENRDFFTRQAEFFGRTSLFHSRRIKDFDYGAKITGAYGEYRIGALDTYDPRQRRNDFVGHVTRQLGRQSEVSLSLVDVRWPGWSNTSYELGFRTRFAEDSPWHADISYARSMGTDPQRAGNALRTFLGYFRRTKGLRFTYDAVSPNFNPVDGFNPRRGFGLAEIKGWHEWRQPEDKWFHSVDLFGEVNRGLTTDGRFYRMKYEMGTAFWFTTQDRIVVKKERDVHLEEHIRPEPFDDDTITLRVEVGRDKRISGRGSFTTGRMEDSRLRQFGVGVRWSNVSGSLSGTVDYNRRTQRYFDGSRAWAEAFEVTLTRVLDPEHWISLRWYRRRGDRDINNLSLVYRIHKASGKELYVILGDPQADQIRRKLAIKYVHPFSF